MADDEEVGLPQKGINMIIKDVLPDLRIANETRDLLNQCCAEFVRHVSREAQQISSRDQRKTIYHDHVQKALKNLGFPREYVDAANSVLGECKIAAEKRLKRKNSRLDKCGIPEEQLWEIQQQLIEKARQEEAEKQAANIATTQFAEGQFMAMPSPAGLSGLGTALPFSAPTFAYPPPPPSTSSSTGMMNPQIEQLFQQNRILQQQQGQKDTNQNGGGEDADEEDYDV